MWRRLVICATACILSSAIASPSLANALTTPQPKNGLRVTPAISQLMASSAQNELIVDQTVTNISAQPLLITAHAQDFGSVGQNGTINFYPVNYKASQNPHGLENSIKLASPSFVLAANAAQSEQVTIANTSSLAAGGHYGAVIYTAKPISAARGKSNISLIPAVASLIFITTASHGTQSLTIKDILQNQFDTALPKVTSFVIANSGNTQSSPIGYVKLTSPGGSLIAQSILNRNSLLVLPGSSILMSVNLNYHVSFFDRPGVYHLSYYYGHSGSSVLTEVTKNFYYLPPQWLVPIAILVLCIYILARKIFKKRNQGHA